MAEHVPNSEIERMPVLSDEDAHRVALILRELINRSTFDMYLGIGRCVLYECFGNSFANFARYGTGDKSTKKVVEHLHQIDVADINETRIYRGVKLFQQDQVHGGLRQRWPKLSFYHFAVAQPVPLDEQPALFDEATEKGLRTRDFEELVARTRHAPEPKPQPKASDFNAVYKRVEKLRKLLHQHDDLFIELRDLGIEASFVKALDEAFDRFSNNVVDELIYLLSNSGARVPPEELKEVEKNVVKARTPQADAAKTMPS